MESEFDAEVMDMFNEIDAQVEAKAALVHILRIAIPNETHRKAVWAVIDTHGDDTHTKIIEIAERQYPPSIE